MIDPHVCARPLFGALPLAVVLVGGGCGVQLTIPPDCSGNQPAQCPVTHTCNGGNCELIAGSCQVQSDCEERHDCTNNKCVLRVESGEVPEDKNDPNVNFCACTCTGKSGKGFTSLLGVCMPPDVNPNRGGDPSEANLQNHCSVRVKDTVEAMSRVCGDKNTTCECTLLVDAAGPPFRDECNNDCAGEVLAGNCSNWNPLADVKKASHTAGTDPVCVVQSSDPPDPTPDPLAAVLGGRHSLCEVDGQTTILIDGEGPDEQPKAHGRVYISGGPCPAGGCDVGVAYQTKIDPIEFGGFLDLFGTTISQLTAGGASLPGIVALGADGKGRVHIAEMRSSGRGRNDDDEDQAIWAQNAAPLDVEIQWGGSSPTCRLHGTVLGGAGDDAEMSLTVDLTGKITNRPPTANAGPDQVLECTSAEGTPVSLDGTGSTDPDTTPGNDNIAVYQWRRDTRGGEALGDAEAKVSTSQTLGEREYHLKIFDAGFQGDEDSVKVEVQDTTPPVVECNAPATLLPSAVPRSFTATATDVCSNIDTIAITGFRCYVVKKGKIIDKGSSCVVGFQGDTLTIYDSGGVETIIEWKATASDVEGNASAVKTCSTTIVKK